MLGRFVFVLQPRGTDAQSGDGRGFGTQDAGAEGDRMPAVLGEKLHFIGCPAAFGAYGQGDAVG